MLYVSMMFQIIILFVTFSLCTGTLAFFTFIVYGNNIKKYPLVVKKKPEEEAF